MVRKLNVVGDAQGEAGLPPLGIRNSGACLNWRKRAMFRSDGRAGVESVIPA